MNEIPEILALRQAYIVCGSHAQALRGALADLQARNRAVFQRSEMRDAHPSQSRSAVADKIVGAARRVTGKAVPAQTQERRPGDSTVFVADGQEDLGTIVDQRQSLPAATRGPTPA